MDLASLMSNNVLMVFAGFEERFFFGFMRIFEAQNPKKVVVYHDKESDDRTWRNIGFVREVLAARDVPLELVEVVVGDYKQSYEAISSAVESIDFNFETCLVDITTMPRDYILIVFGILEHNSGVVNYVYNDPGYYDQGWLQKEYFQPRPVIGFSGVPDLNKDTCAIIVTGYDANCTSHVLESTEAKRAHLAVQTGDKFDNEQRNYIAHEKIFGESSNVYFFRVDAFSSDHGLKQIEDVVKREIETNNIIISAVGPKLSLVALYRLQKKYPEICVNHIVSRRTNKNYSTGVGRSFYGKYISGSSSPLNFTWISGLDVDDTLLSACAKLFTDHYGVWGDKGFRPACPVVMTLELIKRYIANGENWIAIAKDRTEVVGYAICRRFKTSHGKVSWISQLVVHGDYRNQGIATQILNSIWGFSDHYAWGLATSSPYAIRALEKATRRRVNPSNIQARLPLLRDCLQSIFYLEDRSFSVSSAESIVHTEYPVDHGHVSSQIADVSRNASWMLGDLPETSEWLAVTFRDQDQFKLTNQELSELFINADKTVVNAYQGMQIDDNHSWAKHTKHEVDFIINELGIEPGHHVLDFGSGFGRHSIELAKRGVAVTAVDFVPAFYDIINNHISLEGLVNVNNILGDCRTIKLDEKFDFAICLYDVVGSFPDDLDNNYIIKNLAEHLNHEAKVLITTMNYDLSSEIAQNRASVFADPDVLLDLPPSNTMQKSGDIFNPEFYILDTDNSIFYRKEQFESGQSLPCELIVRDKRYNHRTLGRWCEKSGLDPVWHRYVQAGHWEAALDATDRRAKEVMVLCTKG